MGVVVPRIIAGRSVLRPYENAATKFRFDNANRLGIAHPSWVARLWQAPAAGVARRGGVRPYNTSVRRLGA